MKSPLIKITAFVFACAASAAGGYWFGHHNQPAPAAKNTAAAKPRPTTTKLNTVLVLDPTGSTATWQNLLKSKGKLSADLLAAWAQNLSPEEAQAALKDLKDQPANSQRNDLMGALYDAWAQRDPQGFLAATGSITVPRLREGGVDDALKAWAAQDPKAALQWMKDNPGPGSTSSNQQRMAATIAGYAASDPAGALAAVNALSGDNPQDQQLKSAAIKALSDTLTDQGDFSQAAALFSQLPAGQTQNDANAQLAASWASASPQDASAWVASLTDPQQQTAMGIQVAKAWAANDPAAAALWAAGMDQVTSAEAALNNSTGTPSGQLLATAIQSWTNYDLDAAGQFLNQMPPSPTKDSSVAIFALGSSSEDPGAAMQWAGTITDDNARQGATLGVALQWMQQDQNGFNQYLANSTTFTDQEKQALTNITPQMLQRMSQFNNLMGGGNAMQNLMQNAVINGGGLFRGQGGQGGQGGAGGQGGFGPGGGFGRGANPGAPGNGGN
jgi:hypothetical protein